MNPYIERLRPLLENTLTEDMEPFLHSAYEMYLQRYQSPSADIEQAYQRLDALTSHMPFSEADPIPCAANGYAAQYEYEAFRNGFRLGAAFAISLVCI